MNEHLEHEHICPGPGCQIIVPNTKLLCPRHWKQVPFALRRKIIRAYNYGAGLGTPEHTHAVRDALVSLLTWPCDFCKEERPDAKISVMQKEISVPGKTSSPFPNSDDPTPIIAPITKLPLRKRYCNDRPACIAAAQEWIPSLEVFDPG